jgi:hypothetical protein
MEVAQKVNDEKKHNRRGTHAVVHRRGALGGGAKLTLEDTNMNIYQMRHTILAKHAGQRISPAQLKTELLEKFPSVKPQSVNASDCHYSDRKRAGSTCPECGKLGGFAVNRDGIVDMGASGWGNISPVYVPTGNTRESVAPVASATWKVSMIDPLDGFKWTTLHSRYDAACRGFNPNSGRLRGSYRVHSDRYLYYELVGKSAPQERSKLDIDWYEALLYWKLYSQFPPPKITDWLEGFTAGRLQQLLSEIPNSIPRQISDIINLLELPGRFQLPGMKSSTALPVRTTFLHILYPDVVPIVDKNVLKAAGAWHEGASKDINVLRQYIPHAWALADKHTQQLSGFKESPVRLVDMALWVKRC